VNSFKETLPNLIEMEVNFAAGEEADEDDDDYYIDEGDEGDEEIMDEYNDWHYDNAWQGDGDGYGGDSDGDGEEEYSYGGTFGYSGSYY
jgi:hypothetical protein